MSAPKELHEEIHKLTSKLLDTIWDSSPEDLKEHASIIRTACFFLLSKSLESFFTAEMSKMVNHLTQDAKERIMKITVPPARGNN